MTYQCFPASGPGCQVMVRRRGSRTVPERALTLSDVVRFCHDAEVHLVHADLLAASRRGQFRAARAAPCSDCAQCISAEN